MLSTPPLLKTDRDTSEKLNWSLYTFVPEGIYIGALAVRNKLVKVHCCRWDNSQV